MNLPPTQPLDNCCICGASPRVDVTSGNDPGGLKVCLWYRVGCPAKCNWSATPKFREPAEAEANWNGLQRPAAAPAWPALTLEPCPFCGAPPAVERSLQPAGYGFGEGQDWMHAVCCQACRISIGEYGDGTQAAAAIWNRRP